RFRDGVGEQRILRTPAGAGVRCGEPSTEVEQRPRYRPSVAQLSGDPDVGPELGGQLGPGRAVGLGEEVHADDIDTGHPQVVTVRRAGPEIDAELRSGAGHA